MDRPCNVLFLFTGNPAYPGNRISLFLALPIGSIDAMSLQNGLRDIGRTKDAEPSLG